MTAATLIVVFLIVVVLVVVVVAKAIAVVPVNKVGIVLRLGKEHRTLEPGISFVTPFIDKVRLMDATDAGEGS